MGTCLRQHRGGDFQDGWGEACGCRRTMISERSRGTCELPGYGERCGGLEVDGSEEHTEGWGGIDAGGSTAASAGVVEGAVLGVREGVAGLGDALAFGIPGGEVAGAIE